MTPLDLILQKERVAVCLPGEQEPREILGQGEGDSGSSVAAFAVRHNLAVSTITLYVAEDLLFFKRLTLPRKTPDLKEALNYQLGMLVPFAEESYLYTYAARRTDSGQDILLYAVQDRDITPLLEGLAAAGHPIAGLFPESQRYVTRAIPKQTWGLVLPGALEKFLLFSGGRLERRILCQSPPDSSALTQQWECETIYHGAPPADDSGFQDARSLLSQKPLPKSFDMLPGSFRRPDYLKMAIALLLVLNLAGLLALGGLKVYKLHSVSRQVAAEISAVMPRVKEATILLDRQQELEKTLSRLERLGSNPDLPAFLQQLTDTLPTSSYLDQIRLDKKNSAIHIQGYTDDISALTSTLQGFGDIKLKSTSRRRNQTYFQLEISLP